MHKIVVEKSEGNDWLGGVAIDLCGRRLLVKLMFKEKAATFMRNVSKVIQQILCH
jgi:hypothetical protein